MIDCYIINLDRSPERWEKIRQSPGLAGLNVIRVPAVDGRELTEPYPEFSPWGLFVRTSREITPAEIACSLSHAKAIRQFMESGSEYALICEDDVTAVPELPEIIDEVLKYSDSWNFVRLCGFPPKGSIPFADLGRGYKLVSDLKNTFGMGGYLISRQAGPILLKMLLPIRLPADIIVFYGRPRGIREATVEPFPLPLSEMSDTSTIGHSVMYMVSSFSWAQSVIVFLYRLVTRNWRRIHRLRMALTRKWWPPKPKEKMENYQDTSG